MICRIITAKEISISARDRWYEAYKERPDKHKLHDGRSASEITNALTAASPTPENTAKIIGNKSWSHPQCTFCGEYEDQCVEVKDEWDDKSTLICKKCLTKMCILLDV